MARVKFFDTFTDGNGRVVSGGTVTVYLAGTSTLSTIYATEVGSAITGSYVTTATNGGFAFWIDSDDYSSTQKFKIVISKANYLTATYDDVSLPWLTSSPISGFEIAHFGGDSKPAANERVLVYLAVSTFVFPASLTGSYARHETAPTSKTALQILKNDVEIGLIEFDAGVTTGTLSCYVETTFVAGDRLTVKNGDQDDTAAGLSFNLKTT